MTTTREAALEAALNDCIAAIEHADMADGVCCCGDNMENHSEPMNCGHSPVDAGEYHAHQVLTAARAALSTPATEPQGYVDELIEKLRAGVVQCGLHEDNSTELFDIEDANEAMFEAAQALAARPAPQPAAEHEYPDPLIAEDRYEDDQPAVDTRVVAAALWREEAVNAGAPDSVAAGRTIASFSEQSPELQARWTKFAACAIRAIIGNATPAPTYQSRVKPWLDACFGPEIAGDKTDRNHRFLEEALELVQSGGCTASEAHQLVDYVYGRPVGEMGQEVDGVMNTLAALCLAYGRDMHEDGETELARVWTKVEKIRAKQAAKPKHSPLPEHTPAPSDKIAEAARDCRPENYASGVQCRTCGQSWGEDGPEQCPNAALAGKGE